MPHTLQIQLRQHTEFLHFQSKNSSENPEIRMTELKPKLDRFIWGNMEEKKQEHWLKEKYARQNYKDHISLAYKARVVHSNQRLNEKIKHITNGNNKPKYESYVFFQVKKHEHSLISYDQLTIQFFSFHKEVLDTIKKYIEDFFFLHNFGYRQRKGFGSFTVTSITYNNRTEKCQNADQKILTFKDLKKENGFPSLVGMIEFNGDPEFLKGRQGAISVLYQALKGGINFNGKYIKSFLTRYLLDLEDGSIISEKCCIKQILQDKQFRLKNINDNKEKNGLPYEQQSERARATRVVLGMGYQARYQLQDNKYVDVEYTYKKGDQTLERFPSPLIFKVIDNRIYLLLEEESIQYLDDSELYICIEGQEEESSPIPVISSQEFQLKTFIHYWLDELEEHRQKQNDQFPEAYLKVLKSINKIEKF